MTPLTAKKLFLSKFGPKIIVTEIGVNRFFLGVQQGCGVVKVSDSMYFTTLEEANHFAATLRIGLQDGSWKV